MRLRALPLLLALTAADYALWDWSIADGHDILSLVSGLTLLPVAAVTVGMLVVGGARLLGFLLAGTAGRTPAVHARVEAETVKEAPTEAASGRDSSGRLAA